jgi:hypothetical protein
LKSRRVDGATFFFEEEGEEEEERETTDRSIFVLDISSFF